MSPSLAGSEMFLMEASSDTVKGPFLVDFPGNRVILSNGDVEL
jgi:hypothetical protein